MPTQLQYRALVALWMSFDTWQAVAFKLVVVSLLPPVAYYTYLDIYVLACMLFLSVITVLHSLEPWLTRNAVPLTRSARTVVGPSWSGIRGSSWGE